ncbi:FkbM family methyltransferase [Pseudomonas sp. S2_H01]
MSFKLVSGKAALTSENADTLLLPDGVCIPVRLSGLPLASVEEAVLVRSNDDLDVLSRLQEYPHVYNLLHGDDLRAFLNQRKAQMQRWLQEGIYIFGAYKVGTYVAREARQVGVTIKGFIDNDAAKRGTIFDGAPVLGPADLDCSDATIVIASGRYSNQIIEQLGTQCRKVLNMSEFLYAADASHGPEKYFSSVVHEPIDQTYRYISTFLRLVDEPSRQVFNGLIGMRTTLSIRSALETKSAFQDEYFDKDLVSTENARFFVDAGAYTGDTLASLEQHFGPVEQAYLFEPELAPYYEALKRFSDRENVLVFNMGLDQQPSRFKYDPALSCNVTNEIDGPVSPSVVSYIQGVRLDGLVHGKVGLFKLDIEGMEERALLGARALIQREKPVLAVCAYHRADDYWKLIDAVDSIRPDYRISIRHYADILHDITLYFH